MDFFQSQDVARRKTGLLLTYFVAAVIFMIAALYFVVVAGFGFASRRALEGGIDLWRPEILLLVSMGTILVIAMGSLYKIHELQSGGAVVAEQLGGRLVQPNTRDRDERRLLNVVEEMALASGVPVPSVYLLDKEPSINAFAAGFTTNDAVVGVNRGTLDLLSRDELQGVIAHEFSHILNGDMRLNLRLIGLLHGILLLALIGFYLMRASGSGGRNNKGGAQIVLLGVALMVLGYVGLLFARLIKAAVSRQREYLADASAIQFTRNPDGLGGALKKIGGLTAGSRMETPAAEAASHLFFGAFRPAWFQMLSTHPPLVDRIRRIDSHFDGTFAPVSLSPRPAEQTPRREPQEPRSPFEALRRPLGTAGLGDRMPIDPAVIIAAIGAPQTRHIVYAHELLEQLPRELLAAVHDPYSCRAIVAALLLDGDDKIRTDQLRIVAARLGDRVAIEVTELHPLVESQGIRARLPLIEIAAGTLRDLSPGQYTSFRDTIIELVNADQKINLYEFALQRTLFRPLDRHFFDPGPPPVRYPAIHGVTGEAGDLLSALAHLGHGDTATAQAALSHASAALGVRLELRPRSACSLRLIDQALNKLASASPAVKRRLLNAAAICVIADRQITLAEGELLRAIAASLDCPLPPLLASRDADSSATADR